MPASDQLNFGTAGWSYKDWAGTVYPQPQQQYFNHLGFLSGQLGMDFVEVNTSFYRIPAENLVQGWLRKTAHLDHFRFWMKLYQDFSHKRLLDPTAVGQFKQSIEPLNRAGKLEGLLAQFPYSFKFNSATFAYIRKLAENFNEYQLAVEFRQNSWNHAEVINFFEQYKLIWVNIDQPVISLSLPLTELVTNPETSYLRLHGRNYKSWFANTGRDARYNYDYSARELGEIAETIKKLKELAHKIFISGNNHYKGSAVKNLIQLKKMELQEEK